MDNFIIFCFYWGFIFGLGLLSGTMLHKGCLELKQWLKLHRLSVQDRIEINKFKEYLKDDDPDLVRKYERHYPSCYKPQPPGFAPCTRHGGHEGPCAVPLAGD